MTASAIETEGLRKVFGDRAAVKGLTLQVSQGEVFGFPGSERRRQDYIHEDAPGIGGSHLG